MAKFSIEDLQKHFRCSEQLHNCILAELVYLLSSCPSNITSDSVIDKDGLRKYLYGNEYGTSIEKILSLSGYWSNDLESIFADAVGFDGNVFSELFDLLSGVEIMPGLVVKK